MTTAPIREQHTASRAQPPADALDSGAAWEVQDDLEEDLAKSIAAVAEVASEQLLLALEVIAERDGIGYHRWADDSAVFAVRQHEGFVYCLYPHDGTPVSREQALAFVAERKAALV